MHSLINHAAMLRNAHYRPTGFNLFTLLRSASDEVRLHSRFLAFLLDPKGAHGAGSKLLELLLERMDLQAFDCGNAQVHVEYRNIDILVRNTQGQALIIENKIYAEDQDEQLYRYVQIMKREGYSVLQPLYLTLDGRDANPKSCRGIDYQRIGYATHILPWLSSCLVWVEGEAGVRESLLQYIDLLRKLTFNDQGPYMDMLKQTLLKDNNLILVRDLRNAFTETLKDLQMLLWADVGRQVDKKYKELAAPYLTPARLEVERYYSNVRNNKYFGLYYHLGFMPGAVYIELNHRFYCGYYCDPQSHSRDHEWLQSMTSRLPNNGVSSNGLLWRYTTSLNMRNPSDEDLMVLCNPERRQLAAERMADDLYELWREAHEFHKKSKLAQ